MVFLGVDKHKAYSNIKYSLHIVGWFYSGLILFLFLKSGLSFRFYLWLSIYLKEIFILPFYLAVVSAGYYLITFPLTFYQGYSLEHKFNLSTQDFKGWLKDSIKSGLLSYLIGLIVVFVFYFILDYLPGIWWLVMSLFWVFFSLILAKILPVVIIPLFFKYKRLDDNVLRERIMRLASKMNIKLLDCFEIDFSTKTLKANAAFVGVGRTRRVILADTLKDRYTIDEIEVILAHEFAHYRLRHLLKLIAFNSLVVTFNFYVIFKTSRFFLKVFGLLSLREVAAFPLLLLYFLLLSVITRPLEAFISRRFERSADRMALVVTGLKGAFVSMMNKLSEQNLADKSVHPLIKFFFFDHPPLAERIRDAN